MILHAIAIVLFLLSVYQLAMLVRNVVAWITCYRRGWHSWLQARMHIDVHQFARRLILSICFTALAIYAMRC